MTESAFTDPTADDKYWFNTDTGDVEFGRLTPSPKRIGPFDSAEQAARAPEIVAERARAWAEEEEAEEQW